MSQTLGGSTSQIGQRFATGLNEATLLRSGWNPSFLFTKGQQGVWYDPTDLTTMFEDAAGTTPVHVPGNGTADSPVGLLLDKSQSGIGTNGAADYNFFTYTEQFDNAVWTKNGVSVTSNTTTAPDGTATADSMTEQIGAATRFGLYYTFPLGTPLATNSYTFSVYVKQNTGSRFVRIVINENSATRFACVDVTPSTGVITQTLNSGLTGVSSSVESAGNGWYRVSLTATGAVQYAVIAFVTASNTPAGTDFGFQSYTGNGSSAYIWGADIRLTSKVASTPSYQKITSSWAATFSGNHASQSTSTARPTLSARYNLLTYTEQFDNAVWGQSDVTVSANAAVAPDGTNTADKIIATATNANHLLNRLSVATAIVGATYKQTLYVKAGEYSWCRLQFQVTAFPSTWANFDVQNGLVGLTDGSPNATIESVGNGWYKCSISATATIASSFGVQPFVLSSNLGTSSPAYTGTGTSGVYFWGMDLRITNDGVSIPDYQKVVDANTYNSTGFPYYIVADGVDDSLLTINTINLTSTSNITVFAGFRSLSSAVDRLLYETSSNADAFPGSFSCFANSTGGANNPYIISVFGSISNTRTLYAPYKPPVTNIITSSLSTVGASWTDQISVRINGSQQTGANYAVFASSGTFGNYTLSLFIRAASGGNQANARCFGFILRSTSSSINEIKNTETWLNIRAKVY